MSAWRSVEFGQENPLVDLICRESVFLRYLSADKLRALMDSSQFYQSLYKLLIPVPHKVYSISWTPHTNNLYLGLTIDDDEFSTVGKFLSKGDGFRIDFDNDHSGTLFTLGDEVLGSDAGQLQFNDRFIDGTPVPSSSGEDVDNGGTIDGSSVASRVVNDNHFELEHPLCSGDSRDFCLQKGDVVGFRLEYLDAEANGDFGGSYFFPGATNTSEADIIIGDCDIPDMYTYIPAILK